ncbi:MAG: leucine-rich repeat domain-containing protein [Verrucomicrobia bacterium]|nr:leucine-rich repeat domain-containing protein [Verrucomicrobiota bacterium]
MARGGSRPTPSEGQLTTEQPPRRTGITGAQEMPGTTLTARNESCLSSGWCATHSPNSAYQSDGTVKLRGVLASECHDPDRRIGESAFSSCIGLTSVTIGNGVTSIGQNAFLACGRLISITVAGDNAAYGSVYGVLFNKSRTMLIQYPGGKTGHYTIPSSVSSIADRAFYLSVGLVSVTIPDSVTSIGQKAFYYITGLTNITIGNGVASIGDGLAAPPLDFCVHSLHQPDERHDRQRCHQHRGLCVLSLRQPDRYHDRQQS